LSSVPSLFAARHLQERGDDLPADPRGVVPQQIEEQQVDRAVLDAAGQNPDRRLAQRWNRVLERDLEVAQQFLPLGQRRDEAERRLALIDRGRVNHLADRRLHTILDSRCHDEPRNVVPRLRRLADNFAQERLDNQMVGARREPGGAESADARIGVPHKPGHGGRPACAPAAGQQTPCLPLSQRGKEGVWAPAARRDAIITAAARSRAPSQVHPAPRSHRRPPPRESNREPAGSAP